MIPRDVFVELRPAGIRLRSLPTLRAHGRDLPASVHAAALGTQTHETHETQERGAR